MEEKQHKRAINAWVLYDWANSAFATTIMAAVLPVYYASVAAANLPGNVATAYWGYTTSISLLIAALISPILGAIADFRGSQKALPDHLHDPRRHRHRPALFRPHRRLADGFHVLRFGRTGLCRVAGLLRLAPPPHRPPRRNRPGLFQRLCHRLPGRRSAPGHQPRHDHAGPRRADRHHDPPHLPHRGPVVVRVLHPRSARGHRAAAPHPGRRSRAAIP